MQTVRETKKNSSDIKLNDDLPRSFAEDQELRFPLEISRQFAELLYAHSILPNTVMRLAGELLSKLPVFESRVKDGAFCYLSVPIKYGPVTVRVIECLTTILLAFKNDRITDTPQVETLFDLWREPVILCEGATDPTFEEGISPRKFFLNLRYPEEISAQTSVQSVVFCLAAFPMVAFRCAMTEAKLEYRNNNNKEFNTLMAKFRDENPAFMRFQGENVYIPETAADEVEYMSDVPTCREAMDCFFEDTILPQSRWERWNPLNWRRRRRQVPPVTPILPQGRNQAFRHPWYRRWGWAIKNSYFWFFFWQFCKGIGYLVGGVTPMMAYISVYSALIGSAAIPLFGIPFFAITLTATGVAIFLAVTIVLWWFMAFWNTNLGRKTRFGFFAFGLILCIFVILQIGRLWTFLLDALVRYATKGAEYFRNKRKKGDVVKQTDDVFQEQGFRESITSFFESCSGTVGNGISVGWGYVLESPTVVLDVAKNFSTLAFSIKNGADFMVMLRNVHEYWTVKDSDLLISQKLNGMRYISKLGQPKQGMWLWCSVDRDTTLDKIMSKTRGLYIVTNQAFRNACRERLWDPDNVDMQRYDVAAHLAQYAKPACSTVQKLRMFRVSDIKFFVIFEEDVDRFEHDPFMGKPGSPLHMVITRTPGERVCRFATPVAHSFWNGTMWISSRMDSVVESSYEDSVFANVVTGGTYDFARRMIDKDREMNHKERNLQIAEDRLDLERRRTEHSISMANERSEGQRAIRNASAENRRVLAEQFATDNDFYNDLNRKTDYKKEERVVPPDNGAGVGSGDEEEAPKDDASSTEDDGIVYLDYTTMTQSELQGYIEDCEANGTPYRIMRGPPLDGDGVFENQGFKDLFDSAKSRASGALSILQADKDSVVTNSHQRRIKEIAQNVGLKLRTTCRECSDFFSRYRYWILASLVIFFILVVLLLLSVRQAMKKIDYFRAKAAKAGNNVRATFLRKKNKKLIKQSKRMEFFVAPVARQSIEQREQQKDNSSVTIPSRAISQEIWEWAKRHGAESEVKAMIAVMPEELMSICFIARDPRIQWREVGDGACRVHAEVAKVEKQGISAVITSYAFDPSTVSKMKQELDPNHDIVRIWKSLEPGSVSTEIRNPNQLKDWVAENAPGERTSQKIWILTRGQKGIGRNVPIEATIEFIPTADDKITVKGIARQSMAQMKILPQNPMMKTHMKEMQDLKNEYFVSRPSDYKQREEAYEQKRKQLEIAHKKLAQEKKALEAQKKRKDATNDYGKKVRFEQSKQYYPQTEVVIPQCKKMQEAQKQLSELVLVANSQATTVYRQSRTVEWSDTVKELESSLLEYGQKLGIPIAEGNMHVQVCSLVAQAMQDPEIRDNEQFGREVLEIFDAARKLSETVAPEVPTFSKLEPSPLYRKIEEKLEAIKPRNGIVPQTLPSAKWADRVLDVGSEPGKILAHCIGVNGLLLLNYHFLEWCYIPEKKRCMMYVSNNYNVGGWVEWDPHDPKQMLKFHEDGIAIHRPAHLSSMPEFEPAEMPQHEYTWCTVLTRDNDSRNLVFRTYVYRTDDVIHYMSDNQFGMCMSAITSRDSSRIVYGCHYGAIAGTTMCQGFAFTIPIIAQLQEFAKLGPFRRQGIELPSFGVEVINPYVVYDAFGMSMKCVKPQSSLAHERNFVPGYILAPPFTGKSVLAKTNPDWFMDIDNVPGLPHVSRDEMSFECDVDFWRDYHQKAYLIAVKHGKFLLAWMPLPGLKPEFVWIKSTRWYDAFRDMTIVDWKKPQQAFRAEEIYAWAIENGVPVKNEWKVAEFLESATRLLPDAVPNPLETSVMQTVLLKDFKGEKPAPWVECVTDANHLRSSLTQDELFGRWCAQDAQQQSKYVKRSDYLPAVQTIRAFKKQTEAMRGGPPESIPKFFGERDLSDTQILAAEMILHLWMKQDDLTYGQISKEEAIFGNGKGISSMDFTTAMGPGLEILYKNLKDFIEGDYPLLSFLCDLDWDCLVAGTPIAWSVKGASKDEMRHISKVLDEKTRLMNPDAKILTIRAKRLFGAFLLKVQKLDTTMKDTFFTGGFSIFRLGWYHLFKFISDNFSIIPDDQDVEKWDKLCYPFFTYWNTIQMMMLAETPEHKRLILLHFDSSHQSSWLLGPLGQFWKVSRGFASGKLETYIFNCMGQARLLIYTYILSVPEQYWNFADFKRAIKLKACGDDTLLRSLAIDGHLVTAAMVRETYRRFGWNCSYNRKDNQPAKNFTDVFFMGHRSIAVEYKDGEENTVLLLPALPVGKVRAIVEWRKKKNSTFMDSLQAAYACMVKAFPFKWSTNDEEVEVFGMAVKYYLDAKKMVLETTLVQTQPQLIELINSLPGVESCFELYFGGLWPKMLYRDSLQKNMHGLQWQSEQGIRGPDTITRHFNNSYDVYWDSNLQEPCLLLRGRPIKSKRFQFMRGMMADLPKAPYYIVRSGKRYLDEQVKNRYPDKFIIPSFKRNHRDITPEMAVGTMNVWNKANLITAIRENKLLLTPNLIPDFEPLGIIVAKDSQLHHDPPMVQKVTEEILEVSRARGIKEYTPEEFAKDLGLIPKKWHFFGDRVGWIMPPNAQYFQEQMSQQVAEPDDWRAVDHAMGVIHNGYVVAPPGTGKSTLVAKYHEYFVDIDHVDGLEKEYVNLMSDPNRNVNGHAQNYALTALMAADAQHKVLLSWTAIDDVPPLCYWIKDREWYEKIAEQRGDPMIVEWARQNFEKARNDLCLIIKGLPAPLTRNWYSELTQNAVRNGNIVPDVSATAETYELFPNLRSEFFEETK